MRTVNKILLAAAAAFAGSGIAVALDSPHNETFIVASGVSTGACDTCHKLHSSVGGTLMAYASNDLSCTQCHAASPLTPFNWPLTIQAAPGSSGISHHWSNPAVNTNVGTVTPTNATWTMQTHLLSGNLQCATCHNQHGAPNSPSQTYAFNGRYVSREGANLAPTGGPGTGRATITVAAGKVATARGYRVYAASGTKLTMSNNWAQSVPSWLKLNTGNAWAAATGSGDTSGTQTIVASTTYQLNDGANVTILFSTLPAAGDYWDFYVGYPLLRGDASQGGLCNDCHKARNMTWSNVEGTGPIAGTGGAITLGTTVFSHPVGNTLNANGGGYDRTAGVLDANGAVQPSDGNLTNDITLSSTGVVTCLSCHNMHGADSNSQTTDTR
jgi:predicted CXXCH cytochrome family protein